MTTEELIDARALMACQYLVSTLSLMESFEHPDDPVPLAKAVGAIERILFALALGFKFEKIPPVSRSIVEQAAKIWVDRDEDTFGLNGNPFAGIDYPEGDPDEEWLSDDEKFEWSPSANTELC